MTSVPYLKLLSLNVNGLNSPNRRRPVWRYLLSQNPDIIYLQETPLLKADTPRMTHPRFPFQYWSTASTRTAGVAIFCGPGIVQGDPVVTRDAEGRFHKVTIKLRHRTLTLCNAYAPNTGQDAFLRGVLREHIAHVDSDIILGGGFNLVWDPVLDRSGSSYHGVGAMSAATEKHITTLGLMDIWRYHSPDARDYTFYSHVHRSYSRIDYLFISHCLVKDTLSATLSDIPISDHADGELLLHDRFTGPRRPARWRFPLHVLREPVDSGELTTAISSYFENNDLPETPLPILWDAFIATIQGTLTSIAIVEPGSPVSSRTRLREI